MNTSTLLLTGVLATGLAGFANAAEILVSSDITTSTTWTKNNTYNLTTQIYVTNGATLTIEPGTLIQSDTTLNGGGSLAITRGSQIIAVGTREEPIVFTSKADNLNSWILQANTWGNLTIMGSAYISACPAGSGAAGNQSGFLATNVATMEGLTAQFPGDPRVLYGGGNDDDDSGALSYVSFRYGGRVIGLANELNGLSLGGIGRNTDISFVEVMNNVDDGIEIWGGTMNLKNFVIFNVGDDSLDCDQGWRGKAQFGLIVQGASVNAAQGSGVGDNAIEIDGAERFDWVPVTRTRLSNITVVGQPENGGGDHGLALRDGAGVQLTSSILMELGDDSLRDDVQDGDACGGGWGAGNNFQTLWNTPASNFTAPFYTAQCATERVSQITKSIGFSNNQDSTLWSTVDALVPGNGNIINAANSPIRSLTYGPIQTLGGLPIRIVQKLDPRAANNAVGVAGNVCPNDGFFVATNYVGAFNSLQNWALGWTAADKFGFFEQIPATVTSIVGVPANPDVLATVAGSPTIGTNWSVAINHTTFFPISIVDGVFLTVGATNFPLPGLGTIIANAVFETPFISLSQFPAPFVLPIPNKPNLVGLGFHAQGYSVDLSFNVGLTNALAFTVGN